MSSEDEAVDLSEKEDNGLDEDRPNPPGLPSGTPALRTPIAELTGHSNAVVAADWILGGDQIISASWDRTASVWDVTTGEMLHSLVGNAVKHSIILSDQSGYNDLKFDLKYLSCIKDFFHLTVFIFLYRP